MIWHAAVAIALLPTAHASLLTSAEVAKYSTRRRETRGQGDEMAGICDYGASWVQVLVYSGPNADAQFDRLLKSFKKDNETRYLLASLGPDGWVMYPRPDHEYQAIGAFTHAKVAPHVVFVDADSGKPAESAKSNAEAVTKLVLSRLH